MKILFENENYGQELLDSLGLSSYAFYDRQGNTAILPYVGYIYSTQIKDCIFILPKVFITWDKDNSKAIAFGRDFKDDKGENIDKNFLISIEGNSNQLKKDGLYKPIYELSILIYRAIDRFSHRHPGTKIVRRATNQIVSSVNGDNSQTLLDIILSLEKFHREHSELFTYIAIINSGGNKKIHWQKTISKKQPIIQNGKPYYTDFYTKNKVFNYDEELIILFYSVLQYLNSKDLTHIRPNVNYKLFRPCHIKTMIENGRGTKLLLKIRRKYFKDELVQLWRLLFVFFDRAEKIYSGKHSDEALLARSFDRIFEDMVDTLISHDILADLKKNKDNKRIDHIYQDKSLLGDGDIYYIGDSKYYSEDIDLDEASKHKQFTYARNIIQHNIDINNKDIQYRDEWTEGYNFTPNFFLRGHINLDKLKDGRSCYSEVGLKKNDQKMPINRHFPDRPFDRDTLLLQAYDINFLYILSSYVSRSDDSGTRATIHAAIRRDLIHRYDEQFEFYAVIPNSEEDAEHLIQTHYFAYKGQMYFHKTNKYIMFGFDKQNGEKVSKNHEKLKADFASAKEIRRITLKEINNIE